MALAPRTTATGTMTASMIGWPLRWSCWVRTRATTAGIALVKGSHRWGVLDHYSDEITTSYKQWCITPEALREYITDESMIIPIEGDAGRRLFLRLPDRARLEPQLLTRAAATV